MPVVTVEASKNLSKETKKEMIESINKRKKLLKLLLIHMDYLYKQLL